LWVDNNPLHASNASMRDSRLRHYEKEFQLLNYSLVYTLLQQNTKLLHKERERHTHTHWQSLTYRETER
jgi:hypothetical protein